MYKNNTKISKLQTKGFQLMCNYTQFQGLTLKSTAGSRVWGWGRNIYTYPIFVLNQHCYNQDLYTIEEYYYYWCSFSLWNNYSYLALDSAQHHQTSVIGRIWQRRPLIALFPVKSSVNVQTAVRYSGSRTFVLNSHLVDYWAGNPHSMTLQWCKEMFLKGGGYKKNIENTVMHF